MFNIVGTLWVAVVLRPFIAFVDFVTPGPITAQSAGTHIAMMHTMFNIANTVVLLPFVRQYGNLLARFIKPKKGEDEAGKLEYHATPLLESPELNMAKARLDVAELSRVSESLFTRFREELNGKRAWDDETMQFHPLLRLFLAMQEGISRFLLEVAQQDIAERARATTSGFFSASSPTSTTSAALHDASRACRSARGERSSSSARPKSSSSRPTPPSSPSSSSSSSQGSTSR
jgi:phosphate:Na+ symporter